MKLLILFLAQLSESFEVVLLLAILGTKELQPILFRDRSLFPGICPFPLLLRMTLTVPDLGQCIGRGRLAFRHALVLIRLPLLEPLL